MQINHAVRVLPISLFLVLGGGVAAKGAGRWFAGQYLCEDRGGQGAEDAECRHVLQQLAAADQFPGHGRAPVAAGKMSLESLARHVQRGVALAPRRTGVGYCRQNPVL